MAPTTATSRPSPTETPARVARVMGETPAPNLSPPRPASGAQFLPRGTSHEPARGGPGSGRRGSALERRYPKDPRDLLAVQRFALQEGAGERVELLDVRLDHVARPGGAVHHNALDLGVDEDGGLFAEVLGARDLAAEEDVLLALAEGQRAHLLGHAPLADHFAGHLGGFLEVVPGPGGLLLEHDLLGGAASQEDRDAIHEVVLRVVVLVVGG